MRRRRPRSRRRPELTPFEAMRQIESQLAHVWMVRTFLKHSEDDDLQEIFRTLYDFHLAIGAGWKVQDADA